MQDTTKNMIVGEIQRLGFKQPPESHGVEVRRMPDSQNQAGGTSQTFIVTITGKL